MSQFKVEAVISYRKTITVETLDEECAIEMVDKMYRRGAINFNEVDEESQISIIDKEH